jgi:hypothetical protein
MATDGKRIYKVREQDVFAALVRARSQAEAIRHVTANRFSANVASAEELVALVSEGFKVEDATAEAAAA